jgi:hypothetical protein
VRSPALEAKNTLEDYLLHPPPSAYHPRCPGEDHKASGTDCHLAQRAQLSTLSEAMRLQFETRQWYWQTEVRQLEGMGTLRVSLRNHGISPRCEASQSVTVLQLRPCATTSSSQQLFVDGGYGARGGSWSKFEKKTVANWCVLAGYSSCKQLDVLLGVHSAAGPAS